MLELHFLDGNHFLLSRFCVVPKHGYVFECQISKKNVFWMSKEPIALYYRIDNSFNHFREIMRSEDCTPKVQRIIFESLESSILWRSTYNRNFKHLLFLYLCVAASALSWPPA